MEGIPKQDLPHLPVPPLKQTMDRFLKSTKPFLSEEEYQTTEKLVQDFVAEGGVGEKLHKFLEDRAASTENWLSEWWVREVYLGNPVPLPLNQNVGSLHPLQKVDQDQAEYAAAIISGLLVHKRKLYANEIPVEMLGPFPMDMSQYYYLLGSCRVPGIKEDSVRFLDIKNPPKHFVLMHNNRFVSVPVYDTTGVMLNQSQLAEQIRAALAATPASAAHAPIGIFTTARRDVWGRARKTLVDADPVNQASLEEIESSLFVVCFDGPLSELERAAPNRHAAGAIKMLTGGGAKGHAANRWFDKTIQIIVGQDGEIGVSFEHSASDGYAVSVLCDHAETHWAEHGGPDRDPLPPAGAFDAPRELRFKVPAELNDAIMAAQAQMDEISEKFEAYALEFTGYGKEFIKSQKVSPDSYVQLALQLAYYKLHGTATAQYEACTTRAFLHGRTETIRSCTPETLAFVQTMLDPAATRDQKYAAAAAAVGAHKRYAMQAVSGEAVDRPLLGLRLAGRDLGLPQHALFSDPGFTRSSHYRLSTSQVPLKCEGFLFFAPVVPDGYGICYNPQPDKIMISVSAYRECGETSAIKYARALEQAFHDMRSGLTETANGTA